ncbi:MAG: UTP--glucose-1-phosphate uridylyltransferase [Candidatus Omnitrophica bacterium]|nr:UTP--glucose-1-phosphate uridylyltransferase [Candidatus Omnitrophota bacterium]
MKREELISLLEKHEQVHIKKHLLMLSADEQKIFLKNVSGMNFELVFRLYETFSGKSSHASSGWKDILPPRVIDAGLSAREKENILPAGEESIAGGQTAVMIVSGGQGTRLGYPHPKGMYPISPVKGKPLFRIFSEKIRALSLKYKVPIPFLVMTNPETNEEIERFFGENNFFGLEKKDVFFFSQEMLPSLAPDKKLILKDRTSVIANPDGHGGSLKSFWQSGLLGKMEETGITRIFYCHIDNPLVKVDDPLFLGWHIKENADFSLKVVRKRTPDEKVGNFVMADGKPRIIEYIELPDTMRDMKDSAGNPVFWAGSIGIHFINTSFIKSLNKNGFALPYHRQVKKIKQEKGLEKEIWKFETFVFDALPLAGKICCLETLRDEEFAPLKNKDGKDSPDEVRKFMVNLCRKQLADAGIDVPPDVKIEISPLAAQYDKSKLAEKVAKQLASKKKDVYIDR